MLHEIVLYNNNLLWDWFMNFKMHQWILWPRPESRIFGRNNPSYSRGYRGVSDLVGAYTDWDRTGGGGYGGGCCCGGGGGGGGVGLGGNLSQGTLIALLAAAALAFYILYNAVTAAAAAAAARRKRRDVAGEPEPEEFSLETSLFKGRLSILLLCNLNNWIGLFVMVKFVIPVLALLLDLLRDRR